MRQPLPVRLDVTFGQPSDFVLLRYTINAYTQTNKLAGSIGGTVYTPVLDDPDSYPEVRVPHLILVEFKVAPWARRQGVGTKLVEAALKVGAQKAQASISDDILSSSGLATIRSVVTKHSTARWVEATDYNFYRFWLDPWRPKTAFGRLHQQ